jgi:hypothetical protein
VFAEVNLHSQVEVILMKEDCEEHSEKDIEVNQLNRMKIPMHNSQYLHWMMKYPASLPIVEQQISAESI